MDTYTRSIAQRLVADLMRDFNITRTQADAVVGNLAHESGGFRDLQEITPVVPGSRGGFGFAQWTGPRRRSFERWADTNNLDVRSYEANYGFLKHEIDTDPYEGGQFWKFVERSKDAGVDEAAKMFSDMFLRPGIPHMKSRMAQSRAVAGLDIEGVPIGDTMMAEVDPATLPIPAARPGSLPDAATAMVDPETQVALANPESNMLDAFSALLGAPRERPPALGEPVAPNANLAQSTPGNVPAPMSMPATPPASRPIPRTPPVARPRDPIADAVATALAMGTGYSPDATPLATISRDRQGAGDFPNAVDAIGTGFLPESELPTDPLMASLPNVRQRPEPTPPNADVARGIPTERMARPETPPAPRPDVEPTAPNANLAQSTPGRTPTSPGPMLSGAPPRRPENAPNADLAQSTPGVRPTQFDVARREGQQQQTNNTPLDVAFGGYAFDPNVEAQYNPQLSGQFTPSSDFRNRSTPMGDPLAQAMAMRAPEPTQRPSGSPSQARANYVQAELRRQAANAEPVALNSAPRSTPGQMAAPTPQLVASGGGGGGGWGALPGDTGSAVAAVPPARGLSVPSPVSEPEPAAPSDYAVLSSLPDYALDITAVSANPRASIAGPTMADPLAPALPPAPAIPAPAPAAPVPPAGVTNPPDDGNRPMPASYDPRGFNQIRATGSDFWSGKADRAKATDGSILMRGADGNEYRYSQKYDHTTRLNRGNKYTNGRTSAPMKGFFDPNSGRDFRSNNDPLADALSQRVGDAFTRENLVKTGAAVAGSMVGIPPVATRAAISGVSRLTGGKQSQQPETETQDKKADRRQAVGDLLSNIFSRDRSEKEDPLAETVSATSIPNSGTPRRYGTASRSSRR